MIHEVQQLPIWWPAWMELMRVKWQIFCMKSKFCCCGYFSFWLNSFVNVADCTSKYDTKARNASWTNFLWISKIRVDYKGYLTREKLEKSEQKEFRQFSLFENRPKMSELEFFSGQKFNSKSAPLHFNVDFWRENWPKMSDLEFFQ